MPRRKKVITSTEPFVVVVTFPSSSKEYHYLCNDPTVQQGSTVIANGTRVQVLRTAAYDPSAPRATKYVQSDRTGRIRDVWAKLEQLERVELAMKRFAALTSPEAKRLVRELKELSK